MFLATWPSKKFISILFKSKRLFVFVILVYRTFASSSACSAGDISGMLRVDWSMTDYCVDYTYATCNDG